VRRLAPGAVLARLIVARDSLTSALKSLGRGNWLRRLHRQEPAVSPTTKQKVASAVPAPEPQPPRRQWPGAVLARLMVARDSLTSAVKSLGRGNWLRRLRRQGPAGSPTTKLKVASAAPAPESQPPRRQSPAIAAGLSFVWPGLGQLFLGHRRAAALCALPALLIVVWLGVQLSQGALMFAASMWDPSYFLAVSAAVVGLGILRAVAVGHAFLSAPREHRSRPLEVGFVAALLVVIVAMHGLLVTGAWAWYDTSVSIQNNDIFGLKSPGAAASDEATYTPIAVDTSFWLASTAGASPTPYWPPNPNRITFLLVGSDYTAGRAHSLTDSLMLVSLDTSTGKVAMVNVPRDTSSFELYYGGWVPSTFRINTLLNAAGSPSFGSPDPPMKTLENEIGYLVGVPVNYYAALDLDGFSKMIDAVGGVDVYNLRAINDPLMGIVMAPGPVHLDGATAMRYVRSREGGGTDYLRSARQQDLLVALERKVASPAGLPRLGTLLSLAGKTIATDFPLSTARNYVAAVQHISVIEKCVLGEPYSYHPPTSSTGGYWTSRLDMDRVARLSVELFGRDSRYYGRYGVEPAACEAY